MWVQVEMDVLVGRRVNLSVRESAFSRRFGGEQSPADLELALQMVHRLFTHSVEPIPEELQTSYRFAGVPRCAAAVRRGNQRAGDWLPLF